MDTIKRKTREEMVESFNQLLPHLKDWHLREYIDTHRNGGTSYSKAIVRIAEKELRKRC
jgi:hypothetical protein